MGQGSASKRGSLPIPDSPVPNFSDFVHSLSTVPPCYLHNPQCVEYVLLNASLLTPVIVYDRLVSNQS